MKFYRKKYKSLICFYLFSLLPCLSCATKTVTLNVVGVGKVSAVSADNLNKEGQFLGNTPLTIEVDKIQGKILKISQSGKIPAYWVMPDIGGQNIRATLNLADEPRSSRSGTWPSNHEDNHEISQKNHDPKATINRIMRLLLKSYQALVSRDLPLAADLAARASSIDPEIAAPLVIKGIALMQAGDVAGAKAAFSNAKALDPDDQDIEILLKATR